MNTAIVMICLVVTLFSAAAINRCAYLLSRRLGKKSIHRMVDVQSRRIFALFSTYLNFRFADEKNLVDELPPQYLVVSNHQSILDIPLYIRFLGASRVRFFAKAELARGIPLVSLMLRVDQHCLVRRTGGASESMRQIDSFAARVIENDWIPVIFPEGTRSRDGNLGTFHAAGFRRFMEKAPMPVAVCAIDGGWRISSIPKMAQNLKGGFYRVKILRIYPAPTNKVEQMRILTEGKELIQAQLTEWRNGQ
jgi:1-acyl-sn-glycerol-3-phosphate acyltransferase